MIECIFTIDYEIYGNGDGSVNELIFEPAEKLKEIFLKWDARFVNFVEIAEIEMIAKQGADSAIDSVKRQIKEFHDDGFEIGLHLHPQWYNGHYQDGKWFLDYGEYNLCTLPRQRIEQIVDRAIAYFREILNQSDFTPLSFRAGNWLFQPTQIAAEVLAQRGIKIDSSVFKGGLQHRHGLDYRKARNNGYYWKFKNHCDIPQSDGDFLELPIYSQMVPSWEMLKSKRVGLQRKSSSTNQAIRDKCYRFLDMLRFQFPLKFDFCRMTLQELTNMMDKIIQDDQKSPGSYKPIVAIGHTKDLFDFDTVDNFLAYLREQNIAVSTFEHAFDKGKF